MWFGFTRQYRGEPGSRDKGEIHRVKLSRVRGDWVEELFNWEIERGIHDKLPDRVPQLIIDCAKNWVAL